MSFRSSFLLVVYPAFAKLLTATAWVAGLLLFADMWLVFANTISRKLFNYPIAGTLELTEVAMPFVILLPLAFTQMLRGHIHVELVTDRLVPTLRRIMFIISYVFSIGFFIAVTWASYLAAEQSVRIGETAWGVLRVPLAPAKIAIVVASVLMTVQLVFDILKLLLRYDEPSGHPSV